jgi:hypothetical protein
MYGNTVIMNYAEAEGRLQEIEDLPCHGNTGIAENIISVVMLYSSDIWCLYNNLKSFILSTFQS